MLGDHLFLLNPRTWLLRGGWMVQYGQPCDVHGSLDCYCLVLVSLTRILRPRTHSISTIPAACRSAKALDFWDLPMLHPSNNSAVTLSICYWRPSSGAK